MRAILRSFKFTDSVPFFVASLLFLVGGGLIVDLEVFLSDKI